MRIAVFGGAFLALVSLLIGIYYLIMKLVYWDRFNAGQAPLLIVTLFMFSIILIFMGFLGEYIASINQRVMRRPLVVEEERINFPDSNPKEKSEDE